MEKQITSEELQKLQQQQQQYSTFLMELGGISINELDIKQQKDELLKNINNLRVESEKFQQELATKYGSVDINLNTGEITLVDKNI